MIKNLVLLLKRIIGMIKRIMTKASWYMAFATMLIPLGAVVMLQSDKLKSIGEAMLITGMVTMFLGTVTLFVEERQQTADRKVTNNIIMRVDFLMNSILKELQELNKNLSKGDGDESGNSKH